MTYTPNFISSNLTINVPSEYATVELALNSIRNKFIKDDVVVTISVASGIHEFADEETWFHPQAHNIKIVGATPLEKTLTYSTYSGSSYAYTLTFNTDVSSITTDCFALIYPSGLVAGSSGYYQSFAGCLPVTSVGASSITCLSTANNRWVGGVSAAFNACILRTVMHFTGVYGVRLNSSFRSIENIVFLGDGSLSGTGSGGIGDSGVRDEQVVPDNRTVMKTCGFNGWRTGLSMSHTSTLYRVCCSNCYSGITNSGRNSTMYDCAVVGGGIGGYYFRCRNLRIYSSWYSGHVDKGFYADVMSTVYLSDCTISHNNSYGIGGAGFDAVFDGCSVINNSSYGFSVYVTNILLNGKTIITANNGSGYDVFVGSSASGHFSRGTATITGTYTVSPSVRSLGNGNCYIY